MVASLVMIQDEDGYGEGSSLEIEGASLYLSSTLLYFMDLTLRGYTTQWLPRAQGGRIR